MIEPDAPSQESATATLQRTVRLLRLLWHRRMLVLLALASSLCLGALYFTTAQRSFEATAEILVVDSQRESLSTSLAAGRDELTAIATYEKLLTSPLVLQAAAALLEPPIRAALGSQDPDILATVIGRRLHVKGVRQTNIIELRFRAPQPAVTAAVLSGVIQAYARFMDETHQGKAGTLMAMLTREKEAVDAKLQAKQQEFLEIRNRVGDLGLKADGKTLHPLVERAIQFNAALIETEKKRLSLQATHQSLVEAMRQGRNLRQSLMAIEESLGKEVFLDSMGLGERDKDLRVSLEKQLLEERAQLDTLLQYYGDNHPRVIERRKKIEQVNGYLAQADGGVGGAAFAGDDSRLAATVEQILRQRLEATVQHENWLRAGFEQAKADSLGFTSESAKLEVVENDVRWLSELRNTILGQLANIDLRQERGGVKTTIVREPVVPTRPVAPKMRLVVLLFAAGGLAVGIAIVLVLDALDDRVRSPGALEQDIGLKMLATIGTLVADDEAEEAEAGLAGAHMWREAKDASSEGFRTLRTVIVMGDGELRRVSVSSAEPGDGKTTVSINLAIAYQQAGRRVLLIDADLRKPGLTALIGERSRPGLAELLADTRPVSDLAMASICRSGDVPIDVIPSGRRPANPGELLLGTRFADLLGWAETVYDQIIIDAPPVLAGTDAAAIGRASDGLLMVIRPEKNSRHVLRKAVETLRTFHVRLLGAVVNGVGIADVGYGYGYGYGYGSGYGSGYGDEPDDDAEADHVIPVPAQPAGTTETGSRAA